MSFVTFALSFAAMTALSVSMDRHAREALDKQWRGGQRVLLRLIGGVLLATSLFLSTRDGWSIGALQWLGLIAASGVLCVGLLTFLPRRLIVVALSLPVLAAAAAAWM
ncbi:MAG: DUF3325 domain-containing protein [Pseudomonadota bacterium]|nr:DUF3325 domain-containing protein [Pseudomonadota bacterium]